jgi:hypothetical protein
MLKGLSLGFQGNEPVLSSGLLPMWDRDSQKPVPMSWSLKRTGREMGLAWGWGTQLDVCLAIFLLRVSLSF